MHQNPGLKRYKYHGVDTDICLTNTAISSDDRRLPDGRVRTSHDTAPRGAHQCSPGPSGPGAFLDHLRRDQGGHRQVRRGEFTPEYIEKVTVELPKGNVVNLKQLVQDGDSVSVDDAIRNAVREYIRKRLSKAMEELER